MNSGSWINDPLKNIISEEGYLYVHDRQDGKWKLLHVDDIPTTYSFTPKPTNYNMEAKLWLHLGHLVKHKFIWAHERISKADFEKLGSKRNHNNYDRFSYVNHPSKRRNFKLNHYK